MSRNQIFLIVAAAVLVAVLFSLPKVIIDKEKKSELVKPAGEDAAQHSADDGHDHGPGETTAHAAASPEQLQELALLREQYNREQGQAKVKVAFSLGEKYKAIGRFDSAGYFYEQVAQAQPTEKNYQLAADQYYEAFSFAATQERMTELGDKTKTLYEQVLAKNPNNLDAKTNLAMTYIAGPAPMKGVGLLREVLETDPRNEKAIYNMGILSIQSGQYDKAVERFRDLVAVNPNHVNGNFYLGVALAETGKKQEAVQVFNKVKTLDQDPALMASVDEYLQRLK